MVRCRLCAISHTTPNCGTGQGWQHNQCVCGPSEKEAVHVRESEIAQYVPYLVVALRVDHSALQEWVVPGHVLTCHLFVCSLCHSVSSCHRRVVQSMRFPTATLSLHPPQDPQRTRPTRSTSLWEVGLQYAHSLPWGNKCLIPTLPHAHMQPLLPLTT